MRIGTRMPAFEPWDIVKVPFPYTDRPVRQRRPALVLAAGDLQKSHGLLWLAMITSATHHRRPGDVVISDLGGAGLPAPSIVRPAKIATINAQDAVQLGILSTSERQPLRLYLQERLGDLG
jgi:mRNA interferase MazF